MPRLPDASSLGGIAGASGGRPMSSIDASGIGQAQREQGQTLQNLGTQIQQVGDRIAEKNNTLDAASAEADWTIAKAKLDDARSNETDPEALNTYKEKYSGALQAAAQKITDPTKRTLFLTRNSPDVERGNIAATTQQFKLNQDQTIASTNQKLTDLETTGLKSGDAATRAKAIQSAKALVDSLEEEGYISATKAQSLRQSWAQGFAEKAISMMPTSERLAALPANVGDRENQGFQFYRSKGYTPIAAAAIVGNFSHESGGMNPSAVNPGDGSDGSDSLGFGQWNGPRGTALKQFAATNGKDWRDPQVQLAFADQEIAQHPGLKEKLNSAKSIADATSVFADEYERPAGAGKGGYEKLNGWNSRLSRATTIAKNFGDLDTTDPNTRALVSVIPPDRLAAMRTQAEREFSQQNRAEVADVRGLIKDDTASIMETGKPVEALTPDRVEASMGKPAAEQFQQERALATRYYNQTNDWNQIPQGEIAQRLDALRPTPGSAGYENQQSYYNTALDKAQKLIKQRQEDPAGSVDSLPDVRTFKQSADINHPETYLPLVKARLAAQDRIGIPDEQQVPMSRDEARALMTPVQRALPGQERAALQQMLQTIKPAFGDQTGSALEYMLRTAKVDQETSKVAAVLFRKLGLGQTPDATDARALDEAQKTDAANKAVQGVVRPWGEALFAPGVQEGVPNQAGRLASKMIAEADKNLPTPSPQAIQMLRANPNTGGKQFDAIYGPGSAKRVLSVYPSELGMPPKTKGGPSTNPRLPE